MSASFAAVIANPYLQVALGSALGGVSRYGLSQYIDARLIVALGSKEIAWPWATLAVNVIGALAIGLLLPTFQDRAWVREFLAVGILGGFTTFSAFSLQTCKLFADGRMLAAGAYVLSSVALCLLAVLIGWKVSAFYR
jgi:fluoride exporter